MAEQLMGVRLEPAARTALEDLAEMQGVTLSGAVRGLVPSAAMLELFRWSHAAGLAPDYAGWVATLIARGAAAEMTGHADYAIAPHFLRGQESKFVILYFLDWLRALDAKRGVPSVDGQPVEFRLERVPARGEWKAAGVTGWAVLAANEKFTSGGIERGPSHE